MHELFLAARSEPCTLSQWLVLSDADNTLQQQRPAASAGLQHQSAAVVHTSAASMLLHMPVHTPACATGVQEVDVAIAADLGTLQRLPHLVGHGEP